MGENVAQNAFYTNRFVRVFIGNRALQEFKLGGTSDEEKVSELKQVLKTAMRVAENKLIKLMHYKEGSIAFDHKMIELKPTDAVSSKNNDLGRNVLQDVYDGSNQAWNKILELITPDNLIKLGYGPTDPNFTTLAQCLGVRLFEKYTMYISALPGMVDPSNVKLKYLVKMWLQTQKDEENLVSKLISTIEEGQNKTGTNCLNSLISWLKEKETEGN